MALGYHKQLQNLTQRLGETHRYTDIACQFAIYDRDAITGKPKPTGETSPILGGRWDFWRGEYSDTANNVIVYPCSSKQFELLFEKRARIEGNGGRGSGKSEGGLLWCIKKIVELPNEHGQISAPTYRILKIDWNKILAQIPRQWLIPGRGGILKDDKELHFVNGSTLRFVSTDNPDALRSWGGSFGLIDEEQSVKNEALDIIWPSLRLSSTPQLLTLGTPMPGEYYDRHFKLMESKDDVSCIRFDSFSNPFVSPRVFELMKTQMDERTYRQEILAEWIKVEADDLVFYCFSREKHGTTWPMDLAKDITRQVTKQRCGVPRDFIIGCDYNWAWPNFAVIWKVIKPNRWIAIDCISLKGHAGHMGEELRKRGYANSVIIDDASGSTNKGANSSTRLMRAKGFTVLHPNRNPEIVERINAALAKMAPVEGEPSLYIALPQCNELAESFEGLIWGTSGTKLDKNTGLDHIVDAATYPIHYFCPAGKVQRKFQGLMGK